MLGSVMTGGPHPLAHVERFGLAFVGTPAHELPVKLQPGLAGDAVVIGYSVAAPLAWIPGWIIGAPLWMPGIIAAEEAPCRAAVSAYPERMAALQAQMQAVPLVDRLNERLALRLVGRSPQRSALTAPVGTDSHPPPTASPPKSDLLATARERGAQAAALFEVQALQLQVLDAQAGCSVQLFVAGSIRALRATDGALLYWRPLQGDTCKRNASMPLERVLTDDRQFEILVDAATDCATRDLIDWTDTPWASY